MFVNRILNFPRVPFGPKLPRTTRIPAIPTNEKLFEKVAEPIYPYFKAKGDAPPHVRLAQPKKPKRHLTEVTARPLPNTFAPGESLKDYKSKPLVCEKLPEGAYHYPYRYYEICLMRGVLGLPRKIRHIVKSLGLLKRHQVVWRLISPRSAGQILKIKELVHVRLVNEIPAKPVFPRGFEKSGSMLNRN